MTFDLQAPNERKPEIYKNWIRRVAFVAMTLKFSYSELWELPEQEFLVLEELAVEIQNKQKQALQEARGGE